METLIFWIGTLVGLFLGMLLYSLLALAQKAEKIYDWLEHAKVKSGGSLLSAAIRNQAASQPPENGPPKIG